MDQDPGVEHAPPDPDAVERARVLLAAAERIVVLTGAGISTDSGIPDFRGPNGIWTKNPAAEKLATIDTYLADPDVRKRAWQNRLRSAMWDREPNPGHRALVELERRGTLGAVITQNVDGLHQAAGTQPDLVVEVHGTVREVVCVSCGDRGPMAATLARLEEGEDDPDCLGCGGILKSATVLFGENLEPEVLERAFAEAAACDVFLAVGTSLAVYPVAETPVAALRQGAELIICNGEPTQFDTYASVVLRSSISETLPLVVAS